MNLQRGRSVFQVYSPFYAIKPRTPIHLGNTSHKLGNYFQWDNFLKKNPRISNEKNKMHKTILILKKNFIQNPSTWYLKSRRYLKKPVIFLIEKSTTFLVKLKDILMVSNPANVIWKLSIDYQNKFFGNMTNSEAPPHNSKKKEVHLLKLWIIIQASADT